MSSLTLQQLLPQWELPANVARLAVQHWHLDSRAIQQGDGFIGLVGTALDGRQYVTQAIAAGAVVALVEAEIFAVTEQQGVPCLQVPALRKHLGELLQAHYGSATAWPVVAVTGTNGKTTVTGFVQQLLARLGQPWGLLGTLGACFEGQCEYLGLTTADAASVHRYWASFRQRGAQGLVLEASSHALDQDRLAGLPIQVAVWTNIGRDHLDYHGTMEAYINAKKQLFNGTGIEAAVLPADDQRLRDFAAELTVPVVTFGRHPSSDMCYEEVAFLPEGVAFHLVSGQEKWPVKLPVYGAFNIENVLAAVATLVAVGYQLEELVPHLSELTAVPGRMEQVHSEQGPTVIVDFAHTADALAATLEALAGHFTGSIHCVFGCGGDRDAGKRPLMAQAAEQGADYLWLTSDNPRSESPEKIIAEMQAGLTQAANVQILMDRAEAIGAAISAAEHDDVVLIAGKGHEEEQIIGAEKIPFSDKAVAAKVLATWRAA